MFTGSIAIRGAPESVRRGDNFEVEIELTPTPRAPVTLIVESISPLVTPGAERITFGIGQSIANAIFFSAEANVGRAEILLRSRSLRDYTGPNCSPVVFYVNVTGELSSNLTSSVMIGTGQTANVSLTVTPIPGEDIEVEINTSGDGVASPAVLSFGPRDRTVVFEYQVTREAFGESCITFTSPFYDPLQSCFFVAGVFDTDLPSELNTFALEAFNVSVNPAPTSSPRVVSISASANVIVDPSVIIAPGEDRALFQIDALTPGVGYVEFTSTDFVPLRVVFNITEVVCDEETQVINRFGTACLDCPATEDVICSGVGTCYASDFASELARCECEDGYYGPQCEFTEEDVDLEITNFSGVGLSFTTQLIPATETTRITIPPGLLQDGESGTGTFYLQPYRLGDDDAFYGAEDPNVNGPVRDNYVLTPLPSGFNFDITALDNTQVIQLDMGIRFDVQFDEDYYSQRQFIQTELFFYDTEAAEWVPAESVCTLRYQYLFKDLLTLTYRANVCVTGQYQFFQVDPVRYHTLEVQQYLTVTPLRYDDLAEYYQDEEGVGAFSGSPLPPQPYFVPVTAPISPPAEWRGDDSDVKHDHTRERQLPKPDIESISAASGLSVSAVLSVACVLFLALF